MLKTSLWLVVVVVAVVAVSVNGESYIGQVWQSFQDVVATTLGWEQNGPTEKVHVAEGHFNIVDHSTPGLPKVRMGARVIDLVNALHFDDLLQDMPDEMRPPSVVAFYDSNDPTCKKEYDLWGFDELAENRLPARERLMTARYDMYSAPRRAWYKFTPEMDLQKRLGVTKCPELVFVPQKCNGFMKWCVEKVEEDGVQVMGCEDFKDYLKDFKYWDRSVNMKDWIMARIKEDKEPEISPFLKTYRGQGEWIRSRDQTTSDNHLRNLYLSQAFPAYTDKGYKAMPIPKEFNDWLLGFYERHEKHRRTEYWDAASTQMSFHAVPTTFLDMDRERLAKEQMANKFLKPIVEEWSGVTPLELTSFYGMREYHNGSVLKNHVDRIDTHVLSVTITVKKLDKDAAEKNPWPLEVVRWDGRHVRYNHPEGTMVLYESSKLPHGRPFENEGGGHVGCFAHFKPVNMHTSGAVIWDTITRRARKNQRDNAQTVPYRSTPTEEPEHPVYSKVSYGQGSNWAGDSSSSNNDNSLHPGQFTVSFRNRADRTLDVYWKAEDGGVVLQGSVGPNAAFEVNTFRGHVFFWAEHGSEKPLPGGRMVMEKGRSDYSYSLKK